MVVALAGVNLAVARAVPWDVVIYPTLWALLGAVDFVIFWEAHSEAIPWRFSLHVLDRLYRCLHRGGEPGCDRAIPPPGLPGPFLARAFRCTSQHYFERIPRNRRVLVCVFLDLGRGIRDRLNRVVGRATQPVGYRGVPSRGARGTGSRGSPCDDWPRRVGTGGTAFRPDWRARHHGRVSGSGCLARIFKVQVEQT